MGFLTRLKNALDLRFVIQNFIYLENMRGMLNFCCIKINKISNFPITILKGIGNKILKSNSIMRKTVFA